MPIFIIDMSNDANHSPADSSNALSDDEQEEIGMHCLHYVFVCVFIQKFILDTFDGIGLTLRSLDYTPDDIVTILTNVRKISNSNNHIMHKFEKLCELYDNYRELAEQWRRGRKRIKVKCDLFVGQQNTFQHLHAYTTGNTTRKCCKRNGRGDV